MSSGLRRNANGKPGIGVSAAAEDWLAIRSFSLKQVFYHFALLFELIECLAKE
jgi:hypothetical protein